MKKSKFYQIKNITEREYTLVDCDGSVITRQIQDVDKSASAFTIQDAKGGDVLAAHECYVIFKEIDGLNIKCYCTYHYMNNPSFHVDTLHNKDAFHPATKEQRDILFAKIKEAGYEWDENNKMLKEIVEDEEEPQNYKNQIMSEITDLVKHYIKQKPTCGEAGEDMKEALRTEYEKGRADAFAEMQKEWSEEDEVKINRIVACLENLNVADNDILLKDVDWLKSLKYRYAWKPSDEQMNAFEQVYDWYNNNFAPSETLTSLYKDLEKLKGE